MAVQSDTSRIQYAGNNSTTTSYAVPFVFQENSHLKAIARTSAGVESVVTLTNHTGAGNVNGGTVRTAVAVPTTSTLTIYREVPATQTTTYAEGGDFPAASHERALDKLTQIAQQLKRGVESSVRLSEATPLNPIPVPSSANPHVLTTVNGGAPTWEAMPLVSFSAILTAAADATTVNAADELIIQQSGITKRATVSEIKTQVADFESNDITTSGRLDAGGAQLSDTGWNNTSDPTFGRTTPENNIVSLGGHYDELGSAGRNYKWGIQSWMTNPSTMPMTNIDAVSQGWLVRGAGFAARQVGADGDGHAVEVLSGQWAAKATVSTASGSPALTVTDVPFRGSRFCVGDPISGTNIPAALAGSVSSITIAGGIATVATSGNHQYENGNKVTISGASPSGLNGTHVITVTSNSSFTFPTSQTGSVTGTITYSRVVDIVSVTKGAQTVTGNAVQELTVVSGGTGYAVNDIVTLSGGTSTFAATAKVLSVSGGAITALLVTDGGNYTVNPAGTLNLTGGTGSGATCTASMIVAGFGNPTSITISANATGTGTGIAATALSSKDNQNIGILVSGSGDGGTDGNGNKNGRGIQLQSYSNAAFLYGINYGSTALRSDGTGIRFASGTASRGISFESFNFDQAIRISGGTFANLIQFTSTTSTGSAISFGSVTATSGINFAASNTFSIAAIVLSGQNIATDTATGMQVATSATQKLGFFGRTPVARPAAVADATDAATTQARLNDLLAAIRTLGLIAT